MSETFDIVVVGGGHAGAEAASAAARGGASVALVTFNRHAIGRLSCNPAIGGIGKGQMVREIDALGGLMGLVSDEAGIQFRMLNRRKGPAVWAPRAQVDCDLYPEALQRRLRENASLTIVEAGVDELLVETLATGGSHHAALAITGVRLSTGATLACRAVIITSGTFLRGLMHTGEQQSVGGRVGEQAAVGLSASLERLGLQLGRLKTGTPPRLRRDTIDFDRLEAQAGDDPPTPFSFMTAQLDVEQVCCWITYTNPEVHEHIRTNLHRAPMYSGGIKSRGPRYCPSIEDKVVRFADKDRHQLFLEPEGRNSDRIYANGISTSLPEDVQRRVLAEIEGLERAEIAQLGYAVEYDFVPPEQIDATLMTKRVRGLFLAGQINGTSGYEEAAAQGLLAGVNARALLSGAEPLVLRRDEAYIGVMIDDLVTQEHLEPYRMFSSRAEHRLHLRYDNADARLTGRGRAVGLVDDVRWARFEQTQATMREFCALLDATIVDGKPLATHLRQPDVDIERYAGAAPALRAYLPQRDVVRRVLNDLRYAGYIGRQSRLIEREQALASREIPRGFDYRTIPHLRREAQERLSAVRPRNLGQAGRVSGVHPTDIHLLIIALRSADRKNVGASEHIY